MEIQKVLETMAEKTDQVLAKALSCQDPDILPLWDAMRYSVQGGGKRIRPALAQLFCRLFGGSEEKVLPYAAALECIHTYSLIHDDLPCMDDDDLRRGRPSCHKQFGEARAVLAGDGLLTYAFELAASNPYATASDNNRAVILLAQAAGPLGMVAGQEMDLAEKKPAPAFEWLLKTHRLKTGAMIRCAALLGVLAAGKYDDARTVAAATAYADAVGLAFQIIDDLLDYTESEADTGKSASDEANDKLTFLRFMSPGDAFDFAVCQTVEAMRAILPFEGNDQLTCLARYLLLRTK